MNDKLNSIDALLTIGYGFCFVFMVTILGILIFGV